MSSKIKNRHSLKNKDVRYIQDELKEKFPSIQLDKKSSFEQGYLEDLDLIFIDKVPCIMNYENRLILTLPAINKYKPKEKYVVVDMGAIKFVTNGADIMAPGIVDADKDILKDDQVWVCDQQHRKPLAVGLALQSGEEMVKNSDGKAIKNLHYVGDAIWNYFAKSL